MYPVVDASYLMSSSPPQFRCLNCSASQVCSQDGPLYQVRGTHDGTYDHHDTTQGLLSSQTPVPQTHHFYVKQMFFFIFSKLKYSEFPTIPVLLN